MSEDGCSLLIVLVHTGKYSDINFYFYFFLWIIHYLEITLPNRCEQNITMAHNLKSISVFVQ